MISVGSEDTRLHKLMLASGGVPVFDSPAVAAKSLAALFRYAEFRNGARAPTSFRK